MSEEKSLPKNNFGANLTALRKAAGLSRAKLARQLKIPETTLQGYETKGNEPRYSKMLEIAKYFGVTAEELFGSEKIEDTPRDFFDRQKFPAIWKDEILRLMKSGMVNLKFSAPDEKFSVVIESTPEHRQLALEHEHNRRTNLQTQGLNPLGEPIKQEGETKK